ncbi:MAG: Ohr family peroxiredoxin [Thermomicrobiales bacterium]
MSNTLSETMYTAEVEVTGGREGHASSSDGNLDLTLQRPAQTGKTTGATNPEQLFAAGYAACLQSALIGTASRAGHNASKSVINAAVYLGKTEAGGYGLAVAFDVTMPGLDQATAEDLVATAHAGCPYSNAVKGNIDVSFSVSVS